MSDTKFTPGPWKKVPKGGFLYQTDIIADKDVLATVYGDTGENLYNANLIAAAPELYETLLAILNSYAGRSRLQNDHISAGWSAIEKARGNQ